MNYWGRSFFFHGATPFRTFAHKTAAPANPMRPYRIFRTNIWWDPATANILWKRVFYRRIQTGRPHCSSWFRIRPMLHGTDGSSWCDCDSFQRERKIDDKWGCNFATCAIQCLHFLKFQTERSWNSCIYDTSIQMWAACDAWWRDLHKYDYL